MIFSSNQSNNAGFRQRWCTLVAPPSLVGSMVIAVWLGLLVTGMAEGVEIPALSDIPPVIAAAHPELVQQRETLVKDREMLGARARSHNSTCRAVEEGSAAETSCVQALATLTSVGNVHVQASKQFNDELRTAINRAARLKPAPFTDSSVVDAINVPSGLPKDLDRAIATAYSGASPGVSDRVRKGFQAVMGRDWKVAKAWFEDALNRDPGNAGLKRFVTLTESAQQSTVQSATVDLRNEPAGLGGISDFTGAVAAPSHTKPVSAATQKHIQLPEKDYMHLLFPGLQAMDDAQALEFLFGLDAPPPSSKSGKMP